jgi:hypothetical protein
VNLKISRNYLILESEKKTDGKGQSLMHLWNDIKGHNVSAIGVPEGEE